MQLRGVCTAAVVFMRSRQQGGANLLLRESQRLTPPGRSLGYRPQTDQGLFTLI